MSYKLFLELFLTLEVTIAVIIGSLLQNHQSHKRVHLGKELECQLAKEDDLQSKSNMKEIVLRIVFNSGIDYHCNDIACLVRNNKKIYIYRSKIAVPVS